MNKSVLAASIGFDEAKTFCRVEPFYRASSHVFVLTHFVTVNFSMNSLPKHVVFDCQSMPDAYGSLSLLYNANAAID